MKFLNCPIGCDRFVDREIVGKLKELEGIITDIVAMPDQVWKISGQVGAAADVHA